MLEERKKYAEENTSGNQNEGRPVSRLGDGEGQMGAKLSMAGKV